MQISRNIVWNTVGIVLPLFVGLAAIPQIVRELGIERFGFLSVIWMLIGYFSIFDLGLGRTLTKLVADRIGRDEEDEIPSLVSTTLIIIAVSSVMISVAMAFSSTRIAAVLGVSDSLLSEASNAIVWLSIGLPFVLISSALIGFLEAFQKFALISAVRLPLGILIFVAPLAVLVFSKHLGAIAAALAGLRILSTCALAFLTLRVAPSLRRHALVFRRELVRPLFTFGGWLTVSNVVGPAMVYFDRFLIASVLGATAIAFYTVPYDVLTRLWVFPSAMQGVLFPAFATMLRQGSGRVVPVFDRSSTVNMLLMTPPFVAVMLLAREGLELWVGSAFAENSSVVAKVLMVGVLVNAMARTPFAFVQSAGQAKWSAIVHVSELVPYAVLLWILLAVGGIEGAAYAWTGRIIIDTIIFYVLAIKLERRLIRTAIRDFLLIVVVCTAAVLSDRFFDSLVVRASLACGLAVLCGVFLLEHLKGALFPQTSRRQKLV